MKILSGCEGTRRMDMRRVYLLMLVTIVSFSVGTTFADFSRSDVFHLNVSESNPTIDFGFFYIPPPTGQIGNFIWDDRNRDGLQDEDELGINGVTVYLLDAEGNRINETTTDYGIDVDGVYKDGIYWFTNLAAGDYIVEVDMNTLPQEYNWTSSPDYQGDPAKDDNGVHVY
jgi:hypothetical protein